MKSDLIVIDTTCKSEFLEYVGEKTTIITGGVDVGGVLVTAEGEARRNAVDEQDDTLGLLLAYSRIYRKISKQLLKEANKRENMNAQDAKARRLQKSDQAQIEAAKKLTQSFRDKVNSQVEAGSKSKGKARKKSSKTPTKAAKARRKVLL